MSELSPEQIAEIRERWRPMRSASVEALCDTVDALRGQLMRACMQIGDHRAELETLRGIAKRLADGWEASIHTKDLCGTKGSHAWGNSDGDFEPMTPAEVQAIYGQKGQDSSVAPPGPEWTERDPTEGRFRRTKVEGSSPDMVITEGFRCLFCGRDY